MHLSCGDQKTSLKRSQFLTYALQFFYSSYTIPSTHILAYFRISYLVCIKFGLFLACSSHALLISSLFSPQTSTLSPPVPLPLALRLPLRLVRLLQEAPQRPGRERRRSHVEAHGEHWASGASGASGISSQQNSKWQCHDMSWQIVI